jgi:dTDP-4-dehydrorhamnose reductase
MIKPRPRILVLGVTGQVGWELARCLAPLGELTVTSRDGRFGEALDLARPAGLEAIMDRVRPQWVVNAAAYTAVDRAESEFEAAERINAEAPGLIGQLASRHGAGIIHYSTDYVFSGDSCEPYREHDPTSPRSIYGRSKLAGESALFESGAAALVLRTSWVYGRRGHNFFLTMLRLFADRDEVSVVSDQTGSPTWSRMLAEATAQVLGQLISGRRRLEDVGGLYHVTGGGQTTWHGFASAIAELAGASCRVKPISTEEYPTAAPRPSYSVLDNSKFLETFGLALPHWRDSLEHCLADSNRVA